ncbi:uncharacterized protein G2W53_008714 [Senna tora]|uniref:Uncharacterized protein n=1 Tax=Senna tora TaxID=362788 RepID=A0A834X9L2_9FABA|nr:uncharacterized protein G2W53_008714 [Senna tora]
MAEGGWLGWNIETQVVVGNGELMVQNLAQLFFVIYNVQ